ncbi:hypothetical protein LEP1GSC043_4826 [Leptospira weilii str. Ecochallenge]|uniref:Uncharacterized protein n=1 Tax=Leptospira weilii str. Ecochallenge TaxID=1049986 RepID=N1UDD7_9LEPT|nr:hypothetical protein LEP1GSC043_4826 [Leptospira weilii str. Ecochallenge]
MKRLVKFHLRKSGMTRIFQLYDGRLKNWSVSIFNVKIFYTNISSYSSLRNRVSKILRLTRYLRSN